MVRRTRMRRDHGRRLGEATPAIDVFHIGLRDVVGHRRAVAPPAAAGFTAAVTSMLVVVWAVAVLVREHIYSCSRARRSASRFTGPRSAHRMTMMPGDRKDQ